MLSPSTTHTPFSWAATLDAERKAGKIRVPLHRIPILLKDAISTGHKKDSTGGYSGLVGSKFDELTVPKRLRAAGVIVLSKASISMSQWSNKGTEGETAG